MIRLKDILMEVGDYHMQHRAPSKYDDVGSPMHDLSGTYPDDFYSPDGYRIYRAGLPYDMESMRLIQMAKGKPSMRVQIYRAVPKDLKNPKINAGDWVTINRKYAVNHGHHVLDGKFQILSKTVLASQLYTEGNSIHEWGYNP